MIAPVSAHADMWRSQRDTRRMAVRRGADVVYGQPTFRMAASLGAQTRQCGRLSTPATCADNQRCSCENCGTLNDPKILAPPIACNDFADNGPCLVSTVPRIRVVNPRRCNGAKPSAAIVMVLGAGDGPTSEVRRGVLFGLDNQACVDVAHVLMMPQTRSVVNDKCVGRGA